jgi:serine/threonine-protein kinase
VSTHEDWPTRELDVPERLLPEQTDQLPAFDAPPPGPPPGEPPGEPPPARGFGQGLLLGIVVAALVAGAAAGGWYLSRDDEPGSAPAAASPAQATPGAAQKTTVPRVIGYKEPRALIVLGEAHLKPKIVRRATAKPTGLVVSQQPVEGTEVGRDTKVRIVVDAGAPTVAVPDLVGSQYEEAAAALERAGLRPRRTTFASAEKPGTVVDQAPAAGRKIARGGSVVLSVARAEPASVPDVVGQEASAAAAALRSAGFEARQYQVPSTQPKGTVVAQSPSEGTQREKGSSVRINVSAGGSSPATPPADAGAQVPDVVGLPVGEAATTLLRAGLLLSVAYVPSQEEAFVVVAQAREAGTTLERGAHVQINLSRGPSPQADETVPGIVGRDPATARRMLESAGFSVQLLDLPTKNPAQAGKVVEQQPSAGRSVPSGAPVVLFVGRTA